jgi:hypothetical protein
MSGEEIWYPLKRRRDAGEMGTILPFPVLKPLLL